MELRDAHVLVTGASRGIGEGLARAFAAAGARVTLVARSSDAISALARELGGSAVSADLTRADGLDGLIARVEDATGPIDVLVNNAGLDGTGPFPEMDAGDLTRVVELNLRAPMELTRQALPGMIRRGRGHVLNVSSLAGTAVLPGLVAYSTTKAALTHFSSGLRAELRGLPIGVTVVEVGLVPTRLRDSILHNPPTAASFRRFYRIGLLADTSVEALSAAAVRAVARNRRHVRRPRRAWAFPALTEAPRRVAEIILSGVRPR